VDQKDLDAVLAIATPTVRAMIQFQLCTAARPGEAVQLRTGDTDMSGSVTLPSGERRTIWRFRPRKYKTQHFGKDRVIIIGPEAQEIIRPLLKHNLQAHCFSPRENHKLRWEAHRARTGRPPAVTPRQRYADHYYRRELSGLRLRALQNRRPQSPQGPTRRACERAPCGLLASEPPAPHWGATPVPRVRP
jgi:integrase